MDHADEALDQEPVEGRRVASAVQVDILRRATVAAAAATGDENLRGIQTRPDGEQD